MDYLFYYYFGFHCCRNPIITNVLIRRALIGSPSVEVPGFIGSIYSLLIPYAFYSLFNFQFQY